MTPVGSSSSLLPPELAPINTPRQLGVLRAPNSPSNRRVTPLSIPSTPPNMTSLPGYNSGIVAQPLAPIPVLETPDNDEEVLVRHFERSLEMNYYTLRAELYYIYVYQPLSHHVHY